MTYSIHIAGGGSETSGEIRAQLNPAYKIEAQYIARIDEIERRGLRYSNEDFDVLSGARAAIWRHHEAVRLGFSPNCTPTEFWTRKQAVERQS